MKTNVGRRQRVVVWLGVACLGLLPLGPLSAQEPKLRDTLKGHTLGAWSVAYSPDGKTLASGSEDGTIKLWDVQTGKERAILLDGFATSARSPSWPSARTARRLPLTTRTLSGCGTCRRARSGPPSEGMPRSGLWPSARTARRSPRERGPDGQAMGREDGQGANPAGAYRAGDLRGVQPGRQDPGLGGREPDGQAVGR